MALDLTGKELGPFHILERLGQGAMGTVYRGVHLQSGKPAAIKVMSTPGDQPKPTLSARFEREIKLLSQFRHNNIVRIYGASEQDGVRYYAMELVEGRSLDDLIRGKKSLPFERVIHYSIQVCDALQEIHKIGVVHRDLKPPNLMITKDHKVKLTDFGIAKDTSAVHGTQLTQADHTVGTITYMSPEQLTGEELTRRSDLYSLGVIIYRMLTGRLPFVGDTIFDYMQDRMTGKFPPIASINPAVPWEFEALVRDLMAEKPADRPRDAYVVMQRLMEIERKAKDKTLQPAGPANVTATSLEETVAIENSRSAFGSLASLARGVMSTLSSTRTKTRKRKKTQGSFFESATFLGMCLAAIVLAATYLLWPPGMETLYARGKAAIERQGTTYHDWEVAMTRYLDPLMARFPDNPYSQEIAGFRDKIEVEKARGRANRILRLGLKSDLDNATAVERKYIDAMTITETIGDAATGQEMLKALVSLYQEDPEARPWVLLAQEQLANALTFESDAKRIEAKREAVRKAMDRAENQTMQSERLRTYESVIQLYGNDSEVADEVAEAKRRLSPNSSSGKTE